MTTATTTATRPAARRTAHSTARECREAGRADRAAQAAVLQAAATELRRSLVSQLCAAVRNGTYIVDARALAGAMVEARALS